MILEVNECPRCGQHHREVDFRPLTSVAKNAPSVYGLCPTTLHPIFGKLELTPPLAKTEAERVADPNYTPSLDEALRHPKEFVDGMEEV